MTDQKAGVDIENVESYARVDTIPESDSNLDMNPNPSGTSKSMNLYVSFIPYFRLLVFGILVTLVA